MLERQALRTKRRRQSKMLQLREQEQNKVFLPLHTCLCSQILVAQSLPEWFMDTEATKHVIRDRGGFVDYRRVTAGTRIV